MASLSSSQDNTTKVDVSQTSGDNDEEKDYSTCDISMFCKACLHPYSGEQKAGTIVLKCENCGQTDTILEEHIGCLNPQEWLGNLMLNRFMQVVREQKELNINLVDPNFEEDNYQRISHALSEYAFNISAITENIYDVISKAYLKENIPMEMKIDTAFTGKEELDAVHATKKLVELNHILLMKMKHIEANMLPSVVSEENAKENLEISSQTHSHSEDTVVEMVKEFNKEENAPKAGLSACDVVETNRIFHKIELNDSDSKILVEVIQQQLSKLGTTVLHMIQSLIIKYDLPQDILSKADKKLREDINVPNMVTDSCIRQFSKKNMTNSHFNTSEDMHNSDIPPEHLDHIGEIADPQLLTPGIQSINESPLPGNSELHADNSAQNNIGECIENELDTGFHSGSDNTACSFFNLPKETVKREICSMLEHKFSMHLSDGDSVAVPKFMDVFVPEILPSMSCPNITGNIDNIKNDCSAKQKVNFNDNNKDLERDDGGNDCAAHSEHNFNIHLLLTAFLQELQALINEALAVRKKKALAVVHKNIAFLKNEMKNVEEAVAADLNSAYKTKMEKVLKQREQCDERQKQVQEVEQLLAFYASTGQYDKWNELLQQFNEQFENQN